MTSTEQETSTSSYLQKARYLLLVPYNLAFFYGIKRFSSPVLHTVKRMPLPVKFACGIATPVTICATYMTGLYFILGVDFKKLRAESEKEPYENCEECDTLRTDLSNFIGDASNSISSTGEMAAKSLQPEVDSNSAKK